MKRSGRTIQKELEELGFSVLRFKDEEVQKDLDNVKCTLEGIINQILHKT